MLTFPARKDDKVARLMGGEIVITKHAQKRWRERVRQCSNDQARMDILTHEPVIRKAAAFGASMVKLGTRHRLVIEGLTVITVLGATRFSWDRF